MALCLFKCLSACGCRECIVSKFAFYPQNPGYRFEEIEVSLSSSKRQIQQQIEKKQQPKSEQINAKIVDILHQRLNLPRFTQLPSDDQKNYELILVYEDQEILVNDESSYNLYQEQQQNGQRQVQQKGQGKESNQNLSTVQQEKLVIDGKQYQVEIKGVFNDGSEKKQKSSAAAAVAANKDSQVKKELKENEMKNKKEQEKKKKKDGKKEERFQQVEDLNLICFKRRTRENNLICGYHIENLKHKSEIIIIYSHGNSTDIGYMINQALDVSYNLRVNVISYDYSGYGQSQGKPSEKSFIYDLEAMYRFALQIGYKPINIILYGQSIGSGPSTFLASQKKFPVGGLVIHSGFTSGLRITQQQQKAIKKTHVKDFFPNIEFIRKVNAPILIVHGTNDQDIKIHHANDLYEKAKKNYKPFILAVEGAGHNNIEHDDTYRKEYFKKLREFIGELRENRRQLELEFKEKQMQKGLKNQDDRKDSFNIEGRDYIQGFPGDGQTDSFNHIYYKLFTPTKSDSLAAIHEKSISIDITNCKNGMKSEGQSNSYIPPQFTSSSGNITEQNNENSNHQNDPNSIKKQEKLSFSQNSQSRQKQYLEEKRRLTNQKSKEPGHDLEEESKVNQTGQQPILAREENYTVESSESAEVHSNNHYVSPKSNDQYNESFERESDDDSNDKGETEDKQQNGNDKEFIESIRKTIIQQNEEQYENLEQVEEIIYDNIKSDRIIMNQNNYNSIQSSSLQSKMPIYPSSRSLKNQQAPKTPSNLDYNQIRMSVPNLQEKSLYIKDSLSSTPRKYKEDDSIRLHNVTSIIRKKQNSQISAYILDNSSASNQDQNSESLNSSALRGFQAYNQKNSQSIIRDASSSSSAQAAVDNKLKSNSQKKSSTSGQNFQQNSNISGSYRPNYSIKYDQNQNNQQQNIQSQPNQKFNSYQVDSIVKEEITESQCYSSSLKGSLIPTGQISSNLHQNNPTSILNSKQETTSYLVEQNNQINSQLKQQNQNDLCKNILEKTNQLENNGNKLEASDFSKQYEDFNSESSSSPHHSGSIKPVNLLQMSITDSDTSGKVIQKSFKNTGSIKSKDTFKSINSNY